MSTELSAREKLVAEWWFQDSLGHRGELPHGNFSLVYMKTLLDVAAADGELADSERRWIMGFASVSGLEQKMIDELEVYQPGTCQEVKDLFKDTDAPHVRHTRLGLIFYGFRAASADGELHPKEIEALYALGRKLGVNKDTIHKLRHLSEEEDQLRQRRVACLFPDGILHPTTHCEQNYS